MWTNDFGTGYINHKANSIQYSLIPKEFNLTIHHIRGTFFPTPKLKVWNLRHWTVRTIALRKNYERAGWINGTLQWSAITESRTNAPPTPDVMSKFLKLLTCLLNLKILFSHAPLPRSDSTGSGCESIVMVSMGFIRLMSSNTLVSIICNNISIMDNTGINYYNNIPDDEVIL